MLEGRWRRRSSSRCAGWKRPKGTADRKTPRDAVGVAGATGADQQREHAFFVVRALTSSSPVHHRCRIAACQRNRHWPGWRQKPGCWQPGAYRNKAAQRRHIHA
jgi:hypothetical protein